MRQTRFRKALLKERFSCDELALVSLFRELKTLTPTKSRHLTPIGLLGAPATQLRFSPAGDRIAMAGRAEVMLWDVEEMVMRARATERTHPSVVLSLQEGQISTMLTGHARPVTDVAFLGDGRSMVSGALDGSLLLWKECTRSASQPLAGCRSAVTSVDACRATGNERMVCTAEMDGTLRLWDVKRRVCTSQLTDVAERHARFRPNTYQHVATSLNRFVHLYDIQHGKLLHQLIGHERPVSGLAWDPQGVLLATASDDCVEVWNPSRSTQPLHRFVAHGNQICSCAFHPTQPGVLLVGTLQNLYQWHFAHSTFVTIPHAHNSLVLSLDVNPRGLAASAGQDGVVRLWLC
mmetsp:Transcript_25688/g.64501  ORF Transcript_25688/g.64501 Transcript_25688/m.64501 type:complete len:349 (+) Transcript_25688:580-1626(+)